MIKLTYAEGGEVVSDFNLKAFENLILQKVANGNDMDWVISNETPFHLVHLLIARGEVSHEDVVFICEGQELRPNRYGALHNWPRNFLPAIDNILQELLGLQVKAAKHERTFRESVNTK